MKKEKTVNQGPKKTFKQKWLKTLLALAVRANEIEKLKRGMEDLRLTDTAFESTTAMTLVF